MTANFKKMYVQQYFEVDQNLIETTDFLYSLSIRIEILKTLSSLRVVFGETKTRHACSLQVEFTTYMFKIFLIEVHL